MQGAVDYFRFGVTLFGILNPFAAIPMFLILTDPADRSRTARIAGLAVFAFLGVAALSGDLVLRLLGTSLPAFQVAGSIVLFLMALAMVSAQASPQKQTPEEAAEAGDRSAIGVVPLAMPLLVGPGSISSVIIEMKRAQALLHEVAVIVSMAVVAVAIWLVLRLADPIGKRLGTTGLNILNRIFGLLVAAVAVQIFANGLRGLFPALN